MCEPFRLCDPWRWRLDSCVGVVLFVVLVVVLVVVSAVVTVFVVVVVVVVFVALVGLPLHVWVGARVFG